MRALPVIAVAAVLGLAGCGGNDLISDQTTRDFLAYDACTAAVKDQLKAPDSAHFQGNTDVDYGVGGDHITVAGWVDAENSFGAKLRNTWSCTVNIAPNGTTSDAVATVTGP